jgi:uroporphyrinogen-III synthase
MLGENSAMRSILVTRPQPVADEFAEKLRREGYTAYIAPMMEYIGVPADFSDIASYQALIFTSTQAVQILAELSAERRLPVLAVGDTTAAAAIKAGFSDVHSAKGNSTDVAALIRSEAPKLRLKKILHLCSADTGDDITAAAAKTGVEVVRRSIYKAELVDTIPDDVTAALQRGAIDTVMLFSTRTAENFVKIMLKKGLQPNAAKLEAICISQQVASAIRELPWRVVKVAPQPRLESVMQALREQDRQPERRARVERRQLKARLDEHGHVDSSAYAGADRRQADRRTLARRRRQNRVWHEKMKFVNRSILTFSFMFIAIVLAGVFLMAPEYARLRTPAYGVTRSYTSDSVFNRLFSWLRGTSHAASDVASNVASSAADMVVNPGSVSFSQVLSNLSALRHQSGGDAAISGALDRLRTALSDPNVRSPGDVARTVDNARDQDKTLNSLFGSVKGRDVGAAAMLLALNEFRGDINGDRPYAQDLALLKKLTGDDPRMNRALENLAPYAENGVMNRQALQTELGGLAGDIVTAQLQGEDISVQDAAKKRFARLSRASNVNQIQGSTPDAVVARAQLMLDKGDTRGAMRELEKLNGASADAARPWMTNAANTVEADQSSDELTQGVLQEVSGVGGASMQSLLSMLNANTNGSSGVIAPPTP